MGILNSIIGIIFISSLVSILYYFGIMQFIVKIIGGALEKLLGTSKLETLSAAANIFLSQTESPLLIKPYINKLSTSELFTVMVGRVASVSGSVLVGYSTRISYLSKIYGCSSRTDNGENDISRK
ncbi:nucleoside recognition domain-containing protein [Clostridium sp. UBA4395]|uniref:nucleoside recognition domain-containing protein n=1 Tax=Clostridium sp. UBA4395 TaxID=1946360 RepID=UPI0032170A8D